MIKTIKRVKDMTFRDLMKYILDNDIRDKEFRSVDDHHAFRVCANGRFDFYDKHYNISEIYEIEVEEEITEDTEFDVLIEVFDNTSVNYDRSTAREIKDGTTKKIYALIDGELQLIWEREE